MQKSLFDKHHDDYNQGMILSDHISHDGPFQRPFPKPLERLE